MHIKTTDKFVGIATINGSTTTGTDGQPVRMGVYARKTRHGYVLVPGDIPEGVNGVAQLTFTPQVGFRDAKGALVARPEFERGPNDAHTQHFVRRTGQFAKKPIGTVVTIEGKRALGLG